MTSRSHVDPSPSTDTHRVVVIGAGMVAHRFVESLLSRGDAPWRITVIGDEPRAPYDRVGLTSWFDGRAAEDLALDASPLLDPRVELVTGDAATFSDRSERIVTTAARRPDAFDTRGRAPGAGAPRPPVDGSHLPGTFVYRTVDDLEEITSFVRQRSAELGRPLRGTVVGGGLLGLEAAGALQGLDAECSVIHSGTHLLSAQIDRAGGEVLGRLIRERDIRIRTESRATRVAPGPEGAVAALEFPDGSSDDTANDSVTVGVRPNDSLAREAGLEAEPRGGVRIDDGCATNDPAVLAIGEVASHGGRSVGLVAPGYAMAEVAADRLCGGESTFPGFDESTKLKLSGVDVASFGDAFAASPNALDVVFSDPVGGTYKKLVLSDDAKTLLGGVLVGDASAYGSLRPLVGGPLGADPSGYLMPADGVAAPTGDLPDEAIVCSCSSVTAGRIRGAVHEDGCADADEVKGCTRAGATCGSCFVLVKKLVGKELTSLGKTVSNALCEHFDMSRRQLFDAVRVAELTTFTQIIERFGRGRGCDVCKPTVASILSGLVGAAVGVGGNASLPGTNAHVRAPMQKDGSSAGVPRMPGGEVTPEGLVVIGNVAKKYGLYTKLTGGQRIDMFGARLEQLPLIWRELVDAGFESGQAYGKSLRTVKSCVGSTWCRYGVLDAVGMAVNLELRYRGLRSPHKLKLGVSGCARECAEARGKDVGVIATENGWNMYVGGNGGFTPRHAELLSEGLSDAELIRAIDRFFMYYIRTADRLQRTAPWMQELEGGLDGLREVIFEDSLGICDDLDAAMARHVAGYQDEWAAALEDPDKMRRFHSFVNAPDTPDPSLAYVSERDQVRPASAEERESGAVMIAGTTLEVRR